MVKVPFAASQNTLENLQVALAARSGAPALSAAEFVATPSLEAAVPLLPAVLVPSPPTQPRLVFGANAVSRYLGSLLKRSPLSVGEQDVMDVEEIVLRPAVAKVLKSRGQCMHICTHVPWIRVQHRCSLGALEGGDDELAIQSRRSSLTGPGRLAKRQHPRSPECRHRSQYLIQHRPRLRPAQLFLLRL
jgi:hypothetical protein